jgi:tetratricopeptide (TPR) repeat protein
MKLLFLLFVSITITIAVFIFSSKLFGNKKNKSFHWKPVSISAFVLLFLLSFIAFGVYSSSHQPDIQCKPNFTTISTLPIVNTANDYLKQGDFYYDQGNCTQAIVAYTKAIQLNSLFAQAYNNRAYVNMRLRNYEDALADLNKALQINPNYVNALMNRGDIHNYYYHIDRKAAIADYKRVITIGITKDASKSVCGHLFLAKHNGWTLRAYIDFFSGAWQNCN